MLLTMYVEEYIAYVQYSISVKLLNPVIMLSVEKVSYNSAKPYGRVEASEILGECSLERVALVECDENGYPVNSEAQKAQKEFGLVWLSAYGTICLRALWPHSATVYNVLTL